MSAKPRGPKCIYGRKCVRRVYTLDPAVVSEVEIWAWEHSISRSRAVTQLLKAGLKAELAALTSRNRVEEAAQAIEAREEEAKQAEAHRAIEEMLKSQGISLRAPGPLPGSAPESPDS